MFEMSQVKWALVLLMPVQQLSTLLGIMGSIS